MSCYRLIVLDLRKLPLDPTHANNDEIIPKQSFPFCLPLVPQWARPVSPTRQRSRGKQRCSVWNGGMCWLSFVFGKISTLLLACVSSPFAPRRAVHSFARPLALLHVRCFLVLSFSQAVLRETKRYMVASSLLAILRYFELSRNSISCGEALAPLLSTTLFPTIAFLRIIAIVSSELASAILIRCCLAMAVRLQTAVAPADGPFSRIRFLHEP
jgi:hypothetical protein